MIKVKRPVEYIRVQQTNIKFYKRDDQKEKETRILGNIYYG